MVKRQTRQTAGEHPRRLLRRASAAAMLDTSITMMKKLERQGKLTVIRLGGRDVFYPVAEVEALAAGE